MLFLSCLNKNLRLNNPGIHTSHAPHLHGVLHLEMPLVLDEHLLLLLLLNVEETRILELNLELQVAEKIPLVFLKLHIEAQEEYISHGALGVHWVTRGHWDLETYYGCLLHG